MFHLLVYFLWEYLYLGVHLFCDFRIQRCYIMTFLGIGFHVEEGKADVAAFGNLFAFNSCYFLGIFTVIGVAAYKSD